jgi:hypothetical protein
MQIDTSMCVSALAVMEVPLDVRKIGSAKELCVIPDADG